jgi:hypothetical protein
LNNSVCVKKIDSDLINAIEVYDIQADVKGKEFYLDFEVAEKDLKGFKKVRAYLRKGNKWVLLPTLLSKEKEGLMFYKASTKCLGVIGLVRVEK